MKITKEKVLDSAYRILTRRGHSRAELLKKLKKKEYPEEYINFALYECERLGFINDEEFAHQYYEELKYRQYGVRKIELYMYKKGLNKDLIQKTIDKFDSEAEQYERAVNALGKKLKSLSRENDKWKKRQKAYRFLITRGFPSQIVSRVIEDINL